MHLSPQYQKARDLKAKRELARIAKGGKKGNTAATPGAESSGDESDSSDHDSQAGNETVLQEEVEVMDVEQEQVMGRVDEDDEDCPDDFYAMLTNEQHDQRIVESESQCEYALLVLKKIRTTVPGQDDDGGHVVLDKLYNLFKEEILTSCRFVGSGDTPMLIHLSVNFL